MSGGMIPQRGSSLKTSPGIPALTQSLVKDLYALCKDEASCDLMFLVGVREERVMAHKLIVLARCENYKQRKEEWLSASRMIQVKLGKHSRESVKKVVKYLYTGEIEVGTPEVFQVLELCSIFGLSSLESHCVDRIMSQLSSNNVCSVLSMAGNLVEKGSVCFNSVVDRCVMYIELHAKEVVDTEGFLQLSRDCLIQLISSDKLVLSEEDVWRSVIRWGENQAGCSGGYSQWTDDDRLNVKEALSEVIEHVRLLQISSEVFAKEVEPTGLLTMEQTLARYRHAAVPGMISSNNSGNEQLKPRSSRSFFPDSMLLLGQDQYQSLINDWYGTSSQVWIMLYRASRDGYSAKHFHERCDEKGPTLTLVKSANGNMFGGYTDTSWSSRYKKGRYISSVKSFLFTIVNSAKSSPTKYVISKSSYATNNHPGFGPIFGAGADLSISSDCSTNSDSYSNFPHSYGEPNQYPVSLAGDYHFKIDDYEVFVPRSSQQQQLNGR